MTQEDSVTCVRDAPWNLGCSLGVLALISSFFFFSISAFVSNNRDPRALQEKEDPVETKEGR